MIIKLSSIRDSVTAVLLTSQGYTYEYAFQLNMRFDKTLDRTTLEVLRHAEHQTARDQNRQNEIRPCLEQGFASRVAERQESYGEQGGSPKDIPGAGHI